MQRRKMSLSFEWYDDGYTNGLCPVLGPPAQEVHGVIGEGPEEGHRDEQRAGVSPLKIWGSSCWRREGSKENL